MSAIPRWKYWLSYLFDYPLDNSIGDNGQSLHVSLKNGRIMLTSDHAIYSFDDYYINFMEAFISMDKDITPDSEILVLGMGMGAIPYMLEKKFFYFPKYTLIEKDESVIDLATRYSLNRLQSDCQIVSADAYSFILSDSRQYDLICMDVFVDDKVPDPMSTLDFCQLLQSSLKPDGLLLFNRLYQYEEDKELTDEFERNAFAPTFNNYTFIEIEGNRIFFSNRSFLRTSDH